MLKVTMIIFIVYLQLATAKKNKNTTTLEKAATTVSTLFRNVQDFFQDIIDTVTDLMFNTSPKNNNNNNNNNKKKSDWSEDIFKYAKRTLKSGYKALKNMMPVLDMARSTMDDVSPLLPNVTTSQFIESLLNQLVPDLMKNQNQQPNKVQ